MTKKNVLQSMIIEYQNRRWAMRKRFAPWKGNPDYQQAVSRINHKLHVWKRQVRRIERRERVIKQANKLVCEFMGLKTLRLTTATNNPKELRLARKLFCTYALNQGLSGGMLTDFLGCHKGTPSTIRRLFLRSLKTSKENRETWERFKTFLKVKNMPLYSSKNALAA